MRLKLLFRNLLFKAGAYITILIAAQDLLLPTLIILVLDAYLTGVEINLAIISGQIDGLTHYKCLLDGKGHDIAHCPKRST